MKRRLPAAFTLIELMVVIVIIAVLTAILLPVFLRAKGGSYRNVCLSNIRQLGMAQAMYANDYDGGLAHSVAMHRGWFSQLGPYIKSHKLGQCPLFVDGGIRLPPPQPGELPNVLPKGYSLNGCPKWEQSVNDPSGTVLFTEAAELVATDPTLGHHYPLILIKPDIYAYGGQISEKFGEWGAIRHAGGANYAMFDGGAHWYRPSQIRLPTDDPGCNFEQKARDWQGPKDGPHFTLNPD